jgi:class 3 adenylate cyclase
MDERPVTRYATTPDGVSIAYQVTGNAALDVLFPPSLGIPIDLLWEDPGFARFAKRLGGFSRTIWYEPRGLGASGGHCLDVLTDEIMDADITAIVDAGGCDGVVFVGSGTSGFAAIRYAATHPERVRALILMDTYAHYVREYEYPWGVPPEVLEYVTTSAAQGRGTAESLGILAPSKTGDEQFDAWYARGERLGLRPDQLAALMRSAWMEDVRALLPALAVPTLVLHRGGNRFIEVGAGRYLAEHIPGAKYVELPGEDHLFFVGDTDALLDEIEEFLTGGHQAPEGDVVTTTILFTDIVSSTQQSARMGHRKWTTLADAHDAMVRATLARHRGREIKTIGDGFLATFDATTRAVRAGTEIVAAAKTMGLEVRAGVHIGEVEVRPDDVVGLAVSIAKRICDLAGPGHVLVSEVVKGLLVGSDIATSERGTHVLKGVPGEWRLFAVGG